MTRISAHRSLQLKTAIISAAASILLVSLIATRPAHAQTYTILHNFTGAPDDATEPNGDLVQDAEGNLYGTSWRGGTHDLGVVFKLDTGGTVIILHNFTGAADGSHPEGGLFQDPTGNLYGTTTAGGSNGLGTVFELDTNNAVTTLHSFKGGSDGAQPFSTLVSINGDLYGVTQSGGSSGPVAIVGRSSREARRQFCIASPLMPKVSLRKALSEMRPAICTG